MPSFSHALWVVTWVLVAGSFFGVALLGMLGLTRAGYRLATRRGWTEPRLTALTMAIGLVAFLGGWLIYVCWWPLAKLFRPWPRLRIIGPAVGAFTLIVGGGATLATVGGPCAFDPPPGDVSELQIVNDTASKAVVGECNDDACRGQDQRVEIAAYATGSMQIEACSGGELAVFHSGEVQPNGCLREPTENDAGDLAPVRLSDAAACHR